MIELSPADHHQIHCVSTFRDLVDTPFHREMNAICWTRRLIGDFAEIVDRIQLSGNIANIEQEELRELKLSEQGQIAREIF